MGTIYHVLPKGKKGKETKPHASRSVFITISYNTNWGLTGLPMLLELLSSLNDLAKLSLRRKGSLLGEKTLYSGDDENQHLKILYSINNGVIASNLEKRVFLYYHALCCHAFMFKHRFCFFLSSIELNIYNNFALVQLLDVWFH